MAVKPGYKQTEIGELPEDWVLKPLCEFSVLGPKNGYSGRVSDKAKGTKTLSLSATSTGRLILNSDTIKNLEETISSESPLYLEEGDVLVQRANTADLVGTTAIYSGPSKTFVYPDLMMRLRFKSDADAKWFWRQANAHVGRRFFRGAASGSSGSMPKISGSALSSIVIPLPPTKAEQEAIAEALSDADAFIESLEQLVAKKRQIKQGAMQQLLTGQKRLPGFSGEWESKLLGDVIESCSSGATPSRSRPEYYEGRNRWISSGELEYGPIYETIEHISDEAVRKTNLKVHPAGTFLMAITGLEAEGTRGACGIVGAPSTTNQSCMAIYPSKELSTPYLLHYYVFRGNELALNYCQGTKQQSYTAKLVRILPIDLPPTIAEQTAIAETLSDMDEEIAALETKLSKARQLKHGMMQELLTGRIRLIDQGANRAEKSHSWAFNEAVVISVLADTFANERFPLGRKRYTKLSYLLHRHVEKKAEGYLKKAAGPYNPKTKYAGPEKIAQKSNYIRMHRSGKFSGFVAADNIAQAKGYFDQWYGQDSLKWLEQFRYRKVDELEVIATVDMAMQDLISQGAEPTLQAIKHLIASEPEWLPKLQRTVFSDSSIRSAMNECAVRFRI